MSLIANLIKNRMVLTLCTVFTIIMNLLASLWWNAQLGDLINHIISGNLIEQKAIIFAVGTILINAITSYVSSVTTFLSCELLAHDLRMGYARHFSNIALSEIEDMNSGEQASKLQNEINEVSVFLRNNLFSLVGDGIRFLGTFSYLLWLNPRLTLLTNIPVIFLIWYTVFTSKKIGLLAQQSQQANTKMSGYADILVSLFPIIKLYDAKSLLMGKYNESLSIWEHASIKEERTKARLMSPSGAFSFLPLLLLFYFGGRQVIQGTASIGLLYIFVNLSGNVSGVLMNMPSLIAGFRRFTANMKRITPLINVSEGR